MSLLISSYLNGQLWKKYNEDKANKAAAEILELEKPNQSTYSEFICRYFDEIIKKDSILYESEWQGLESYEKNNLVEIKESN